MLALVIPFCLMLLLSAGVMFAGTCGSDDISEISDVTFSAEGGEHRHGRIFETQFPATVWACYDHYEQKNFYITVVEEGGSFTHNLLHVECKQVYP